MCLALTDPVIERERQREGGREGRREYRAIMRWRIQ